MATVGILFTVMVMFEEDAKQGGLEIIQAKTLLPNPIPVIEVLCNKEFVITPLPEINDHVPVPFKGKFPEMFTVGFVIQTVWLEPAFATVGT